MEKPSSEPVPLSRQQLPDFLSAPFKGLSMRTSAQDKHQTFKLLQYFSVTSLSVFTIATVILGTFYRQQALNNLIRLGEEENVVIAQIFANSVWSEFGPLLTSSSPEELKTHPETIRLQRFVQNQMQGSTVAKLKIFNRDKQVIFSTDLEQIGEQEAEDYTGLVAALSGNVETELEHKDTFKALNGSVQKRSLLSSYVPVRPVGGSGEIEAVLELYSDVTPLLEEINQTQRTIVGGVIVILGLLYLILFWLIRYADRLIQQQHHALETSESQYKTQAEQLQLTLAELQNAQSQIIQSEKMAALGQLVAGVAHEINTPLGAIQASAGNTTKALEEALSQLPQLLQKLSSDQQADFFQLLDRALHSQPLITTSEKRPFKKALTQQLQAQQIENPRHVADLLIDIGLYQEIEPFLPLLQDPNSDWILQLVYNLTRLQGNNRNTLTAVERASKVVFALKSYSRSSVSSEKQLVQVTDGIKTVLDLYQNNLKQGIEVIQDYQPLPEIWAYPDELIQVWTNLIHNAIQAMKNQGTLRLATRCQNQQILVEVTDSGSGISPEIQARVFEPFFTTKPIGEGSGLGLHICQTIVEKHQGKLEVVSQPGQTIFRVWLPLDNSNSPSDLDPVPVAPASTN